MLETYGEWAERWHALCVLYSEKAVARKLEELTERGYIEYGVSARIGWLTEKGKAALQADAL